MVRYLKRLKSSKFVRVKAFPMYGGMGVSAPSLHRESTDSLIVAASLRFSLLHAHCLTYELVTWEQSYISASTAAMYLEKWPIAYIIIDIIYYIDI